MGRRPGLVGAAGRADPRRAVARAPLVQVQAPLQISAAKIERDTLSLSSYPPSPAAKPAARLASKPSSSHRLDTAPTKRLQVVQA